MSHKRKNNNDKHKLIQNDNLRHFSAKTQHQKDYIRSIYDNIVTICYGCAGTGKSMCSIGIACQQLCNNEIKHIIVCKPIVGCDNEIGTLPGSVGERIHPYMYPVLEYFEYFLGKARTQQYLTHSINMFPIELIRGHTYHNTFMILEEAQNCTPKQIKLFLSRIGDNSKIVIIGDNKQSDIRDNGLQFCIDYFIATKDINIVQFDQSDILRHPVIPEILNIFEKNGI